LQVEALRERGQAPVTQQQGCQLAQQIGGRRTAARALAIVLTVVTVCGGAGLTYLECSALKQTSDLNTVIDVAIRAVLNPAVSDCPHVFPARCSCLSPSAASLLFVSSSHTLFSPLLQSLLKQQQQAAQAAAERQRVAQAAAVRASMVTYVTHFVIVSFHLSVSFYQVSCERYDAKALLKHWDNGFIILSGSVLAYGSTGDKAVSRALDGGSLAAGKVMPISGCVCAAVSREGRPHVMSVSFPATLGVPEQCFAFATSAARDSFMRALPATSVAPAAPDASASDQVASEAKNTLGGKALIQVNLPRSAVVHFVSNAAARNLNMDP
jgi:hypothetical protein